jgi:hypothetical protein
MAKEKITTSKLLSRLFKTVSLKSFINRYFGGQENISFSAHINELCRKNKTIPAAVISKSGIERTFGHQLFNGRRKPTRDKVIQLAFGFEMNFEETQELLKTAQQRTLYPKLKRDAVIIYALNRGFTVKDVQTTLAELSIPMLGREERYG